MSDLKADNIKGIEWDNERYQFRIIETPDGEESYFLVRSRDEKNPDHFLEWKFVAKFNGPIGLCIGLVSELMNTDTSETEIYTLESVEFDKNEEPEPAI